MTNNMCELFGPELAKNSDNEIEKLPIQIVFKLNVIPKERNQIQ